MTTITSTIFINKLKNIVSLQSNIYIQSNQLTFLSIAELIGEIKEFNQIQILIGNETQTLLNFSNIGHDYQLRSDFQSILKAEKLLNHTEDKIEIKKGFYGVNSILLENDHEIKGFNYTHDILNSQVLEKPLNPVG